MAAAARKLKSVAASCRTDTRDSSNIPDRLAIAFPPCDHDQTATIAACRRGGPETSMDSHELRQLLEAVSERPARRSTQAAQQIRIQPFQDAGGFAKVDLHRRVRCGFPEVIFGQGKTAEQIEAILRTLLAHGQGGLVTRVDPDAAAHLKTAFPEGEHNPSAGRSGSRGPADDEPKLGRVVIVTAGTSDLPVAEEARVTAEAWNCEVVARGGRRRRRTAPAPAPASRSSRPPMPWWSSPAWKGPARASSADWSTARSSPCRPASATEPTSRAWPPSWGCSIAAPRTSWS